MTCQFILSGLSSFLGVHSWWNSIDHIVSFKQIDSEFFTIPAHLSKVRGQRSEKNLNQQCPTLFCQWHYHYIIAVQKDWKINISKVTHGKHPYRCICVLYQWWPYLEKTSRAYFWAWSQNYSFFLPNSGGHCGKAYQA